jgi:hypothetical protein
MDGPGKIRVVSFIEGSQAGLKLRVSDLVQEEISKAHEQANCKRDPQFLPPFHSAEETEDKHADEKDEE